jgi:hypothetical protein
MVVQVLIEPSEILDLSESCSIVGNRIKENQRVVLANVVVCVCHLIGITVALESGVRYSFLILSLNNSFGVEKISNGGCCHCPFHSCPR